MRHTQGCSERSAASKAAIDKYWEEWPNHCQKCRGWGVYTYMENLAPHGAGTWNYESSEPCPSCSEEGICPRCGKSFYAWWHFVLEWLLVWLIQKPYTYLKKCLHLPNFRWEYYSVVEWQDDVTCAHCGWKYSDPDGYSDDYECDCWEVDWVKEDWYDYVDSTEDRWRK